MVNIYVCENCGERQEIPQGHNDNEKINVSGIVYIKKCKYCSGEE